MSATGAGVSDWAMAIGNRIEPANGVSIDHGGAIIKKSESLRCERSTVIMQLIYPAVCRT
jgi:hypothetical protein